MLVTFLPIFVADTKLIFGYNSVASLIKIMFADTHREKLPSNKTLVLTKSMNMNICLVGTSNEPIIRRS